MQQRKTSRRGHSKARSGISEAEIETVEEMSNPRTPVIYEVVRRQGKRSCSDLSHRFGGRALPLASP